MKRSWDGSNYHKRPRQPTLQVPPPTTTLPAKRRARCRLAVQCERAHGRVVGWARSVGVEDNAEVAGGKTANGVAEGGDEERGGGGVEESAEGGVEGRGGLGDGEW
jgi:hypothetical protein